MSALKIKNYTSQVSVERTVSMIEAELVKVGASNIEKTYLNGSPDGVIFSITFDRIELSYKLPAKIDAAKEILKQIPTYKTKKKDWIDAQSKRTAWKIIYDWVLAQVAMIMLHQADPIQIFLPYTYNRKTEKTFYEQIKGNQFKLLTGGE